MRILSKRLNSLNYIDVFSNTELPSNISKINKIINTTKIHLENLTQTEIKSLDGVVQVIDKKDEIIDAGQEDSAKYLLHFMYSNAAQIKLILIVIVSGIILYCILKRNGPRNISIAAIPIRETSL